MKLILTSFAINTASIRDSKEIFYRMPPVSMGHANTSFLPDYPLLLLADEIIVDQHTIDYFNWRFKSIYWTYADLLDRIRSEGFLRVENFEEILVNRKDRLDNMIDHDMAAPDAWLNPLAESARIWEDFSHHVKEHFGEKVPEKSLSFSRAAPETMTDMAFSESYRIAGTSDYDGREYFKILDWTKERAQRLFDQVHAKVTGRQTIDPDVARTLRNYLMYVNTNLILSNEFNAPFHDWMDFAPFYRKKFEQVGRDNVPGEPEMTSVKKLFEVVFPDFISWTPDLFVAAIKDKRISRLRELVNAAVEKGEEFDSEFAINALKEVLRIEKHIGRARKIVSYATAPIGFIPGIGTPLQMAAQAAVTGPIERKARSRMDWFYLISELADQRLKEEEDKS